MSTLRNKYLDDPISSAEWEKILAVDLPKNPSKLLAFLHDQGGGPVSASRLPEFVRAGHASMINVKLGAEELPYRLARKGRDGQWTADFYGGTFAETSLKLFKIEKIEPRNPSKRSKSHENKNGSMKLKTFDVLFVEDNPDTQAFDAEVNAWLAETSNIEVVARDFSTRSGVNVMQQPYTYFTLLLWHREK